MNLGREIAGITFEIERMNFAKIEFWSKTYENHLEDQWPVWNINGVFFSAKMISPSYKVH